MDAIAHQREFDAEVARIIGQTRARCPTCGYAMGDLDEPRCPECGRSVRLWQIGEYGTTAETGAALRLHGPVGCGVCGVRITESSDACCPGCRSRIKLSWFPAYARGPRTLSGAMNAAVVTGALGVVANVIPAATLIRMDLLALLPALLIVGGGWLFWVWRIRHGAAPPWPWLVAAVPWVGVVPAVVAWWW